MSAVIKFENGPKFTFFSVNESPIRSKFFGGKYIAVDRFPGSKNVDCDTIARSARIAYTIDSTIFFTEIYYEMFKKDGIKDVSCTQGKNFAVKLTIEQMPKETEDGYTNPQNLLDLAQSCINAARKKI